jgi:hypothetical protein
MEKEQAKPSFLGIAEIIKEFREFEKERNNRKLARELTRLETKANATGNRILKDFVENYKKNIKFLKECGQ